MISLRQLIAAAYPDYPDIFSVPESRVAGLECDSRKIEKDFVFVAVRGVKKDGGEFIREAVERGALAVVGESQIGQASVPFICVPESRDAAARLAASFYGHPSKKMKVIGITGTNGKTTTSYLIEHLLKKENKKTGVIGTVNYRFGGKEIPARETTPGPLRLQAILSEMNQAGCEYTVMEVSSHALDQKRTGGVDFESALFTNLTQDHLDYHKTLEAYFEAKSRLFFGLAKEKTAVLNADDERVLSLKKGLNCKVLTYGLQNKADLRAENLNFSLSAVQFEIMFRGKKSKVNLPLIGLHNVYNALGSMATLAASGLDLVRLAEYLKDFPGVPGRLEAVHCGQDFSVFIDFAHTPDGLENVLNALVPYKKRRLVVLFGCGGDRDKGKRPKMAEIASRYADNIFLTSDNPRSENPRGIAEDIQAGFPPGFKNYSVTLDRKKAIRRALLSARRDDIVLLAGKGHERTQVIGDRTIPFNEREEAERVLHGH